MILKELILRVSTLGVNGGLKKKSFLTAFYIERDVVVLKELIFNSFYIGRQLVVLKELILTVSTLGGCGSLERTDF